jgi:UDP-N-acetylglucosamine 2-epimerase
LSPELGLQKEAYFHKVRCVTMREQTEWNEAITCGWNRLWQHDEYRPRVDVKDFMNDSEQLVPDFIINKIKHYH